MPQSIRLPSYRLHKPSSRAVVTINKRDHYLGPYGSAESKENYRTLIGKFLAGQPVFEQPRPVGSLTDAGIPISGVNVSALVLAYLKHAEKYYRKNGKVTDEFACIKSATRPLLALCADTECAEFGSLALQAVMAKMVELGWSRTYINKSAGRIRRIFRYGILNEMIHPTILQRLQAVPPLLENRCDAVELPKRTDVPIEHIDAVRAIVNEHTRDLIDLALLSGARPGELIGLTTGILDRSGEVWTAVLDDHKMSHKGKQRVLAFGPKSQLILRKYLKGNPTLPLFPINRKTFSDNIVYACTRLNLPKFTAHWLRHNAASDIRRESGLDAAQLALGHSDQKTTQIYAHLEPTDLINLALKRG